MLGRWNHLLLVHVTDSSRTTLQQNAEAYEGKAKGKADVTINLSDDTFIDLADGKVNGQKAFMSGKLKVKGNIMLATKLDGVLKAQKSKL